ncbi:hypothetical protein FACS189468_3830 [Spirochaetia bacterium]|nr:hypothetical protein FACS189468_3830 [Spirochaetia bacterium]
MKNNEKLPNVIWGIGLFMVCSSIAFVLYILLLNIFMDYNVPNNYIEGIFSFVISSIVQYITNCDWRQSNEKFTQFMLPGKQMEIEVELNNGNITKEDAKNKQCVLQKKADLAASFNACSGFFSKISKTITISLICIIIIFLTIDGLKIFIIDSKYIMAIIIYGIVTELMFFVIQFYTVIIINRIIK